MIDHVEVPLKQAITLAEKITNELKNHCDFIQVVGEARRKTKVVENLEFLVVPKWDYQHDLLGNKCVIPDKETSFDNKLNQLFQKNRLILVQERKGIIEPVFCQLPYNGMTIIFHFTIPSLLGLSLVRRTGPTGFFKLATRKREHGGYLKDDFSFDGGFLIDKNRTPVHTPTERDFFNMLACGWVKPEERR